nr:ATP-binding protein [Desulfogranum marinum]
MSPIYSPIIIVFLYVRIGIENPDILQSGLTIEDMKQSMSKIQHHVIARLFRELGLIEQWPTEIRGIFREAQKQELQEPELIEYAFSSFIVGRISHTII